jgi:hypothetical protein
MPFTKYNFIPVPGLNIATVQQIAIGNFISGNATQIYVNKLDWPGHGFKKVAPMVLSLGESGQIADITNQAFPSGLPSIYWSPRVGIVDLNQDGYSDIYVADGGADAAPYPGSQDFMLLSNGGLSLASSLYGIPTYKDALNHGFGIGDISGNGSQSILAVGFRHSYQAATELLVNNGVTLVNSPNLIPAFLSQTGATGTVSTYTWSGIIDLTGSGRGDLIFGQWDESKTNSFVLLNNGKGDFSKAKPIDLPSSGVPFATVVQITPIDIFGRGVNDLVLSITTGGSNSYSYPYLQFLKNVGNGQFEDITGSAFSQVMAKKTYYGDWNIFVTTVDLNCDGREDLLVQSVNQSSYYLLNKGDGTFAKGGDFGRAALTTIHQNGVPTIISTDQTAFSDGKNDQPSTGLKIYQNDLPLGDFRYFTGSASNPNQVGTIHNDIFTPGYGKETFDGLGGVNKVALDNARADYVITLNSGNQVHIIHKSNPAIDVSTTNVQRFKFSDKNIALDLAPTQSAGQTALLIGAVLPGKLVFDVSKQALLGSVIGLFDQNFTLAQLSGAILRLPIWDVLTGKGATTNADIASYLVHNVYGGTQTAAITNAAIAAMNAESGATQGNYLASLAASVANQTHVDLVGIQSTGLVYLG